MKELKTMTPHVKKSWKGQLIKYEGRIKPEQLWAQIDDEGYFFVELWKPLGTERPLTFNLPVGMYNEAAEKHNKKLLKRANPILDKCERKYLSAVIKPFKKDIECIVKYAFIDYPYEHLVVKMKDKSDWCFPMFPEGSMYKGMELDKKYTMEELGL